MINVGYYSVDDLRKLILPFIAGEFYESTTMFRGEFLKVKVKVLSYNRTNVLVKRISITTDMNGGAVRNISLPNSSSDDLYWIPRGLFKKYYKNVFL